LMSLALVPKNTHIEDSNCKFRKNSFSPLKLIKLMGKSNFFGQELDPLSESKSYNLITTQINEAKISSGRKYYNIEKSSLKASINYPANKPPIEYNGMPQ